MRWLTLLACLIAAAVLVLSLSIGAGTSRSVSLTGQEAPEWQPSPTPDLTIQTVVSIALTSEPTATWTPRPPTTPRPTKTPRPYCYGKETPMPGTSCNPQSPTPEIPPTHIVTVLPLTCATVAVVMTAEAQSVPSSCTWDGGRDG